MELTSWEYMLVTSRANHADNDLIFYQVLTVNGKPPEEIEIEAKAGIFGKQKNIKAYPPLHLFLEEHGKLGWEVCTSSYVDTTTMSHVYLILKRPRAK